MILINKNSIETFQLKISLMHSNSNKIEIFKIKMPLLKIINSQFH